MWGGKDQERVLPRKTQLDEVHNHRVSLLRDSSFSPLPLIVEEKYRALKETSEK